MFKSVDSKQNFPKMEEEVLKFWEENKIFEKSLENRKDSPLYTFYDGPPFATGTPHYGHLVASAMKDIVPRYFTMRGFYVPRIWGWDCHGLPIENIVEKELGSKNKKDIEKLGVEKFNELCRSKVLKYVTEWKTAIKRFGRWADMENPYKTMDLPFMESVWWVFKELYDRGLIYEGYRAMYICPRCETTLSQSEVAEGYKNVKDLSVIAKFELVDEPGTYVLAWTTTPWTLIGNVALAAGKNIKYKIVNIKQEEGKYIIAADRLKEVLKDKEYKIVSEVGGENLVGKKYKPLFDYYAEDDKLKNRKNGWKIYAGDFVTTEEGTGVVHIAPAFGEDDMNLGKQYNLPFIQHVRMDGVIKPEARDFDGLHVKPLGDTQKTDVEIIKNLAHQNLLFAKEKYEHSYPHCWRCETPLINYATSSWFVSITKFKERMIKLSKDINWSPKHIKEGRWGKWLEGARDWSISRQRFWASVMPIWRCNKCNEIKVIGSVDEIREGFGNPNKLFLVRHGEADNNIKKILTSSDEDNNHLTDKGKETVESIAKILKKEKIDVIFCSPFLRTKETAQIISDKTGAKIIIDERLKEVEYGKLAGFNHHKLYEIYPDTYGLNPGRKDERGIEGEEDIRKRVKSLIEEINYKYKGKNITLVSHGDILRMALGIISNLSKEDLLKASMPNVGTVVSIYSKPVDLHKHVVDKITFPCKKCKGVMKRIPDVLDTWFDSGSMPYAQSHYPFENKEQFEKGFPAEFIAEGVDQTRAWFYYLHVIASGIKDSIAFKNVAVNGIVLAEDGKKMAKRLQNYPDPSYVMEKYGADALRYYLTVSPVMQAENLNFKEADLAELTRGMFRMLWNSYSFFVLYANIDKYNACLPARQVSSSKYNVSEKNNLLDRWIVSELQLLIKDINQNMEKYELTKAARLFPKFIDNLSNWYIRRSRKRFWKSENDTDKNEAYETLHYVLVTLSKLMAPFTPFVAEEIWRNLTDSVCHPERSEGSQDSSCLASGRAAAPQNDKLCSVHLANFPEADEKLIDEKLNIEMEKARETVTIGLQKRASAGIKVRQPLLVASIKYNVVSIELQNIIKEELNIKEIVTDEKQEEEVKLNTEITEDLKLEGQAREIIRFIQEMRKEAGYQVDNRIKISYSPKSVVFEKFGKLIAKETLADEIKEGKNNSPDLEKEFKMESGTFNISIKKQAL